MPALVCRALTCCRKVGHVSMVVMACLTQRPVHAHFQSCFKVLCSRGDDALRPHAHRDVVKKRLRQLLLHVLHITIHLCRTRLSGLRMDHNLRHMLLLLLD